MPEHDFDALLYREAFDFEVGHSSRRPVSVARKALPFFGIVDNTGAFRSLPQEIQTTLERGSSDCSFIELSNLAHDVEFSDEIRAVDIPKFKPREVGLTFSVPIVSGDVAVIVDECLCAGLCAHSYCLVFLRTHDQPGWKVDRSIPLWES